MCVALPARVVAVHDQRAEVELPDGTRARVDTTLAPTVAAGQFVLIDRGVVLDVIQPDEAKAILAMYAELTEELA
jgi:hydrogenase expression/formation protein HypC